MIMKNFDIVGFDFSKNGVNSVRLRIQPVPGKYTSEQKKRISYTIKRYIGDDCELNIEYLEELSPLPNGKRTYFLV